MFKTVITSTPFSTEEAERYFKERVIGDSFGSDISFVSTLRALVSPRMGENELLVLKFGSSAGVLDLYMHRDDRPSFIIKHIAEDFNPDASGTIYIHNCMSPRTEDNRNVINYIDAHFASEFTGWGKLEKITTFFQKQFHCVCYINPEQKSVAIFADLLDTRYMHYLQCAILAFLPWFFNPDEGVSELEMQLIESLRQKSPRNYEDTLAKMASSYDFRTAYIRNKLQGFETAYERRECADISNRIRSIRSSIEEYNFYIDRALSDKHSLEVRLLGLEAKIAASSGESEIMDYFLCNKKLSLTETSELDITFIIRDYLSYFDEEMAKSVINNPSSYVYKPRGLSRDSIIPSEDMKRLMEALFIDQTLKVRFCAAYRLTLNGRIVGIQSYGFGAKGWGHMPNPHINNYSCLGNYNITINNLLKEGNYISAIEQCAASCKSLNFGDSTVMQDFMMCLYGLEGNITDSKYIVLPDGTSATSRGAIKWLKEQEGISNEQND